jgi:glycine dehydrogenase subunit 1
MPGRIVGQTVDKDGKRGFVLTLQTREQHIRREKATSNICSNQALMALRSLIYMTCVGKEGLGEIARQCFQKAHYLAREIQKIPGFALCHDAPFFHEFAVRCPVDSEKILSRLRASGIYGGVPLSRWFPERTRDLLVAVTECRTRAQMDRMVALLKENAG